MTKKKAPGQQLLDNIAAARKAMAKRQRKVLDLANTAADTPVGDPRGDQAREILGEVGARVQLEVASGVPLQFRTDPARAIADELERGTGAKFAAGRKVGTASPIRKRMAALLRKSPAMKNTDLWEAIKVSPPKGHLLYDEPSKYVSAPNGKPDMDYRRFCNVAAELRREVRGKG